MRFRIKTVRDTWVEDYGENGLIVYDDKLQCDRVVVLGPVDQDDMDLAGLAMKALEEKHGEKPKTVPPTDPTEDED